MDWKDAGADKKRAKDYNNFINPPAFNSESDKSFSQIITLSELHLMLWVVNTIFKHTLAELETQA